MLTEKTWKPELLFQLVVSFLLAVGIGGLAIGLIQGAGSSTAPKDMVLSMFLSTLILHGGSLVCMFFLLRLHKVTWNEAFGFADYPKLKAIAQGIAAATAFLPIGWSLVGCSSLFLKWLGFEPEIQAPVKVLQESVTFLQQVSLGFVTVILAPLAEEVIFRGVIYTSVKQAGFPRGAIWGSSLVFALIHNNSMSFVSLTLLALVLVWLYERTGNLLSCIAAHAFFNLVNFVMLINQPAIEAWAKKQQGIIW